MSKKDKNREYFDQHLLPEYKNIFKIICASIPIREDAEDLTQQVFIKAWKGIDNLQELERGLHWLRKIASNEIKLYYRKNKVRMERLETKGLDEIPEDTLYQNVINLEEDLSDIIVLKESQTCVMDALWSLDKRNRIVIAQNVLLGITLREIADNTGINYNTILGWKYWGLKKLRDRLVIDEEGGVSHVGQ